MPTKTFAFTPAQVKLIRLLCTLDHGALGLTAAQSRTATSIETYLRGNARAEAATPTEPREIIVNDVEGALFDLMSRRG